MFEPNQTPEVIRNILLSLELNSELAFFVNQAFRIRVKYREVSDQMTLQLRCNPPTSYDQEQDLEVMRLELQNLVNINGIDYVALDYLVCCDTGCQGCECFLQK